MSVCSTPVTHVPGTQMVYNETLQRWHPKRSACPPSPLPRRWPPKLKPDEPGQICYGRTSAVWGSPGSQCLLHRQTAEHCAPQRRRQRWASAQKSVEARHVNAGVIHPNVVNSGRRNRADDPAGRQPCWMIRCVGRCDAARHDGCYSGGRTDPHGQTGLLRHKPC